MANDRTCKNYKTDGGDTLIIGGKIIVDENATVEGLSSVLDIPEEYVLPAASASAIGGVKQGAAVADAAGSAPTAAEFKALLDSLRTAGIIATASAE